MGATVADEVYREVTELTSGAGGLSRAEAIRRVAAGMGKSVAAVSSAYYSGARRAGAAAAQAEPRHGRRGQEARKPGSPALYLEMLPLVEAGATVRQAARRFGGDADEVEEIAAGFLRWREEEYGREAALEDAAADEDLDVVEDDEAPDDGSPDEDAEDAAAVVAPTIEELADELEEARRTIAILEARNAALQAAVRDMVQAVQRVENTLRTTLP